MAETAPQNDIQPLFMKKRYFPCWLTAAGGAVLLGVTVPVLLACFHTSFDWQKSSRPGFVGGGPLLAVQQFLWLEAIALFWCGPGALILSLILYSILKNNNVGMTTAESPDGILRRGRWTGVVLAFVNLPGYLSGFVLGWEKPFTEVRVALLFITAGGIAGSWIGWQAYRFHHLEAGVMLRYSLTTLMICVFVFGALLTVFAPGKN